MSLEPTWLHNEIPSHTSKQMSRVKVQARVMVFSDGLGANEGDAVKG